MHRWLLWIAFVVCGGMLAVQLFVPPFIGLASNGDFPKVTGWLSLAPPEGWQHFLYFQSGYVRSPEAHWRSSFYSSELLLAWLATRFGGTVFDIRVLGAVHVGLYLGAFAILLFTDVCYVSYLNSFYMDAAALCGLLLLTACAVRIAMTPEPGSAILLVYGFGAFLFAASKAQHALWALPPALFLGVFSFRWRVHRTLGLVVAVGVLASGVCAVILADPVNRGQALYNQLFFRIGVGGPEAKADLLELGVRPEELRWIGTHSYVPETPAANNEWLADFYSRIGHHRLLWWYARHPRRTAGILWDTLAYEAPRLRQGNLSNFRRADGHPPGAQTNRFAAWSNVRAAALDGSPWLLPAMYALFVAGAVETIRASRSQASVNLGWVALGLVVLALGEFTAAALADRLETGRHLFLFHVSTDLLICFAVSRVVSTLPPPVVSR